MPRVAIAVVGAAIWGVFGLLTGLALTVLMLVIARSGAGIGRATITPSHNSLLSDYYPPEVRPDVFGFHAIGLAIGAFIGPLVAGLLGQWYGWRLPFFVFVIPTIVFVILGMRLHEPGRGHWERSRRGRERRGDRHRRDPAVVRGVDPHPVAGRARCGASGTRSRSSRRRSSGWSR